jgi:Recombinational DNA repair ATPase (RecF pathway)
MKEIRLENFRCYTSQVIRYKSGINLLIGDNASGKTSILKACRYVLSAFFSGFSDENTKWISPDIDDFTIIEKDGIVLPEKPIVLSFTIDEDMYKPVSYKDIFFNPACYGEYQLRKNTKKNSRSLISGIKHYRDYAKLLYSNFIDGEHGQVYPLPLFAGFTTEDIHASRKIDSAKFQSYAQKSSFGYYECLSGERFFPYWINRLLILEEGGKNKQEVEIVKNAIISALGVNGCNIIDDMQIRPNQKKVY